MPFYLVPSLFIKRSSLSVKTQTEKIDFLLCLYSCTRGEKRKREKIGGFPYSDNKI